jgi:hypothetical protein
MILDGRSAILAAIGFVAGAAVVSLLPSGLYWATRSADAQVVAVRKLADLPTVRVVGAVGAPGIDAKHRGHQIIFKP